MHAARQSGLDVPTDLAVIGWTTPRSAACSTEPHERLPGLGERGRRAAQIMLGLVEGTAQETRHVDVGPTLLVRESTRPTDALDGEKS